MHPLGDVDGDPGDTRVTCEGTAVAGGARGTLLVNVQGTDLCGDRANCEAINRLDQNS